MRELLIGFGVSVSSGGGRNPDVPFGVFVDLAYHRLDLCSPGNEPFFFFMEEDKPFGSPDQDFVFRQFAEAEYEVRRQQIIGTAPGISFDDFAGRNVQQVDSCIECSDP